MSTKLRYYDKIPQKLANERKRLSDAASDRKEKYGNILYARNRLNKIIRLHENDINDSCYANSWILNEESDILRPFSGFNEIEVAYNNFRIAKDEEKIEIKRTIVSGFAWFIFYISHYIKKEYDNFSKSLGFPEMTYMEIVQECFLISLGSIFESYDPSSGASFYTYSIFYLKYKTLSSLFKQGFIVSIRGQEKYRNLMSIIKNDTGTFYPKNMSSEEFRSRYNCTKSAYFAVYKYALRGPSLDESLSFVTKHDSDDTSGDNVIDTIQDRAFQGPEERTLRLQFFKDVISAVDYISDSIIKYKEKNCPHTLNSKISNRYSDIWKAYYLDIIYDSDGEMLDVKNNNIETLESIADKYGVTRERIRQILSKINVRLQCNRLFRRAIDGY